LAAFERGRDRLGSEGIKVVAASTDPLEKARETVDEHSLSFPVGYGLPLKETARTLGAFYEERRQVLNSTGFLIRPDGTVAAAQYSSRSIGRLTWQEVVALVQLDKSQGR
jgi:peroxiredoxin